MNKKGYEASLIGAIGYLVCGATWTVLGIVPEFTNIWWLLCGASMILNAISLIMKIVSANKENTELTKSKGGLIFCIVLSAIVALAILTEYGGALGLVPLIFIVTSIIGLIGLSELKKEVSKYWQEKASDAEKEKIENSNA